jgi:tetratricopeptide (TPR) repeat protein
MAEKRQESGIDGEIKPADVTLNSQPQRGASPSGDKPAWRPHLWPAVGLVATLALLLGVVFVLPGLVTPVERPVAAAANTADESDASANGAAEARGPSESPWQDAQVAKARRQAQEVLQKMLEKQEELEAIRVDLWAADEYGQAVQQAEAADQHYQSREFSDAQRLYENALQRFTRLLDQSDAVFGRALASGDQALLDGNAELATEQYQLAQHINAQDDRVQAGLQRAAVLEDVLAEVDAGEQLQRSGDLDAAKGRFQAALDLDSESELAQQRLSEIEQAIADRDFGKHMSAGFSAMADGDYPRAISTFKDALAIRPQADDARNALKQAENESTQTRLQSLLAEAAQHEQSEQWQEAVEQYQQALKIDPNLVAARVGSIRAGTRAEIDRNLEKILAKPERLTTPAVHQEYQAFLAETRKVKDPGPRLTRQLNQLQEALHLAVQPVAVEFQSDNMTDVTIYRVGKLGNFGQTRLSLKPGTYTAVGTRAGYRDVRQEFTVSANSDRSPIVIQCVEKISKG